MPPQPNPGNARVNDEKNTALMIAAKDGDLARVQQILALPEHKPPKLDLANKYGWRAIHFAAKNGNVEILNALVAAGANINSTTKKTSTPLAFAIFHRKPATALRLIALGADVNIGTPATKPRSLAFGMEELEDNIVHIDWDIATALVNAGVDLERFDFQGGHFRRFSDDLQRILLTLVHQDWYGPNPQHHPPPQKVLDLVTAILERHPADMAQYVNRTPRLWRLIAAEQYAYTTDILARRLTVASMRLLLDNGMRLVLQVQGQPQPDAHNPILKARQGRYSPEMNAFIMERFPVQAPAPVQAQAPEPERMWKGWTRGDLGRFDAIFDAEMAHNYSICPICFKITIRNQGCMYMYHDCKEEQRAKGGIVHDELYTKYKGVDGKIWWCTVCGRICRGHTHYDLLPPFTANPTVVRPDPGAPMFGNDCKGANKGGGLEEKVARFRRAREYALELQGEVDRITETQALKEIMEEMWKAPIERYEVRAQKILREGRFNIPNANFPPNVAPAPAPAQPGNNAPAPNVNRPQANRNDPALRPEVVEEPDMMNALSLDDIPKGIKFHHRKADGTIYHHDAPIGRPGFIQWFGPDGLDMAKNFAEATFGHCFEINCNAILYPEELAPFVDTAEEEKFIPRDLFETYKRNFNRHMPARLAAPIQGGYKRIGKTRKVKGKRKQHGGQPHDMFLELESAQCLLPRKGQVANTNAKGGRRNRKTRRHTRR